MRKIFEIKQQLDINAEPEVCYRMMCEFHEYPKWHKYVRNVKIIGVDKARAPTVVDFDFHILGRKMFKTVLEYDYNSKNNRLGYRAVGGDFQEAEGYYHFRRTGPGKSRGEFYIKISFPTFIPLKIANFLIDKVMKGVLVMLKTAVEKK